MRVEGSTGLGWPKQWWSDTMNADIRWLDLDDRNDLSDRVRWKSKNYLFASSVRNLSINKIRI